MDHFHARSRWQLARHTNNPTVGPYVHNEFLILDHDQRGFETWEVLGNELPRITPSRFTFYRLWASVRAFQVDRTHP